MFFVIFFTGDLEHSDCPPVPEASLTMRPGIQQGSAAAYEQVGGGSGTAGQRLWTHPEMEVVHTAVPVAGTVAAMAPPGQASQCRAPGPPEAIP